MAQGLKAAYAIITANLPMEVFWSKFFNFSTKPAVENVILAKVSSFILQHIVKMMQLRLSDSIYGVQILMYKTAPWNVENLTSWQGTLAGYYAVYELYDAGIMMPVIIKEVCMEYFMVDYENVGEEGVKYLPV